ncbi:hypothetical protein Q8F55_000248 [Vanrija albida]|uniref:Uncharacterized protein n=1 Tax=Vanrija albida TaxID=181172 RepID=A0ABR3QDA6_9TREE
MSRPPVQWFTHPPRQPYERVHAVALAIEALAIRAGQLAEAAAALHEAAEAASERAWEAHELAECNSDAAFRQRRQPVLVGTVDHMRGWIEPTREACTHLSAAMAKIERLVFHVGERIPDFEACWAELEECAV